MLEGIITGLQVMEDLPEVLQEELEAILKEDGFPNWEAAGERLISNGTSARASQAVRWWCRRWDAEGKEMPHPDWMERIQSQSGSLAYANLAGWDLREANLSGFELIGANLTGATLTGADLRDANMFRCKITGAHLVGVKRF